MSEEPKYVTFKDNVVEYLKIDDEIIELKKKIKELTNKKEPLETDILDYLESVGQEIIEFKGNKLKKNKSETKGSCKIDMIREAVEDECGDVIVAEKVVRNIENKRPKSLKTFLKRSKK
jgi:hypothetical protein